MQTVTSPAFSYNEPTGSEKLVSVLLPNLNNHQFLATRFETILAQSYENWELIVVDSYSDDGAWEIIQQYARRDCRIKASQAPKKGIYAGLNRCINLSKGDYIYIATSDDTMTPDCLEKMVSALEERADCDICHCCLTVIDEFGKELASDWTSLLPAQFFGSLLQCPHVRIAPHDAILYCCLNTVYSSLTQLLVRRSVFDKVGLFKSQFGSQGDLEWGIRAASQCNTLHIPYALATWRRHPDQASKDSIIDSPQAKAILVRAVKSGLQEAAERNPDFQLRISLRRLTLSYRFEQLERQTWAQPNALGKLAVVGKFFFLRPDVAIRFFLDKSSLVPFDRISYAKSCLAQQGLTYHLQKLSF